MLFRFGTVRSQETLTTSRGAFAARNFLASDPSRYCIFLVWSDFCLFVCLFHFLVVCCTQALRLMQKTTINALPSTGLVLRAMKSLRVFCWTAARKSTMQTNPVRSCILHSPTNTPRALEHLPRRFYLLPHLGWTPLMSAASAGHLPIVSLLLRKDADVNVANDTQRTALFYACSKGHAEIVKQLLKSGAQVNTTDETGSTPLHRFVFQYVLPTHCEYSSNGQYDDATFSYQEPCREAMRKLCDTC